MVRRARAECAAKTTRALADAKASVDANLKAIAAADQENATKRDQRAASKDGMTPSERAMSESAPANAAAKRRKQDGGKDPVAKIAAKADRKPSGLDLAARVLERAQIHDLLRWYAKEARKICLEGTPAWCPWT